MARPLHWFCIFDQGRVTQIVLGVYAARAITGGTTAYKRFKTKLDTRKNRVCRSDSVAMVG